MSLQSVIYSVQPAFIGRQHSRSYVLRLDDVESKDAVSYHFCVVEPCIEHMSAKEAAQHCSQRDVPVQAHEVQALWETARSLTLHAVPPVTTGLDGITYILTIECGFNEARYTWWPELPEEWKALEAITNTLTRWAAGEGYTGANDEQNPNQRIL